jgi:Domain of unknown function (DUF4382)/Carboxypeptidase regulatory-like domain
MSGTLTRFIGLALIAVLASCTTPSSGSKVSLLLTDAPADEASALQVNFGTIELLGDSSPVTISTNGGSFDVLQLQNGQTALMGEATIPDGSYSQLRVVVKDATITVNGVAETIMVPSGAQTGLKINIKPPLQASNGKTSVITLDFNARRVVERGNSGNGYLLTPTAITATTVSGTLEGQVVDAQGVLLAGATISVLDSTSTEVTSAVTGTDGKFKIITLLEGSYSVNVNLDGYTPQSFNVAITANQATPIGTAGVVTLIPIQ